VLVYFVIVRAQSPMVNTAGCVTCRSVESAIGPSVFWCTVTHTCGNKLLQSNTQCSL
jgi:hypothetical protein